MKRDITVSISLWILAGLWIAAVATGTGQLSYGSDAPLWFYVVFGLFILSLLRAVVLFFQTLIDSIRPRDQKNARIGWAVLHFFLGFIASYLYYYIHKPGRAERIRQKLADSEEDLKRRANEGSL